MPSSRISQVQAMCAPSSCYSSRTPRNQPIQLPQHLHIAPVTTKPPSFHHESEPVIAGGVHRSYFQRQITNRYSVCVVWPRLLEPYLRPANIKAAVPVAAVRVTEVILLLEEQALLHQQLANIM